MRPLVLIILDGWGYSAQKLGNAIANANTPTMDLIQSNYPAFTLQASGNSVGLSWGEPGNSEVGHLTIGAGRTIFQYSARINRAIESGDFFKNPAFLHACDHAKKYNGGLHLAGLIGSGTVHSSMEHIAALLKLAHEQAVPRIYLHLFSDGKDSGLKELPQHLHKLDEHLKTSGASIATVIGRKDAMDRDTNWDRTKRAFDLMVSGKGTAAADLEIQIQNYYDQRLEDSSLPATVVNPSGTIKDNDSVIFFNFREDSMRQIARSFVDPAFNDFPHVLPKNLYVSLMTQYVEGSTLNLHVAFPLPEIHNGLAETFSVVGKKQLHIAETEKYAHATYFFNCLRNIPYEGEEDILLESLKNDKDNPEMRANEIADKCVEQLANDLYDFIIINFANADVLSHIGNLEVTVKGIEFVDAALAKIYQAVTAKNGIIVITADHGNAESLVYKNTGDAETKHDLNPVPLYIVASEYQHPRAPEEVAVSLSNSKGLISDVAPTILELLQMPIPAEMTGTSLVSQLASG